MSSSPEADEIWNDASWLALAFDSNAGLFRFIRLAREAYREATFLDDRALAQPLIDRILPWAQIVNAAPGDARRDARWIFHIGHVGSTLISRLLGELDGVFALREPRILHNLLFFPPETRARLIPVLQALMSRTFEKDQVALIKATSVVSDIAAELIGSAGPSLFLFVAPRIYIQTILAGENSQAELKNLAEYHAVRLHKRGIVLKDKDRDPARLAAAVWACEMAALEGAAEALPKDKIMWRDFEGFLEAPVAELGSISSFFGFEATQDRIAEIAGGPLMRRYSKLLNHEYSPGLRRELLDQAELRYRHDIDGALEMLVEGARTSPLLSRAIDRAAPEI